MDILKTFDRIMILHDSVSKKIVGSGGFVQSDPQI